METQYMKVKIRRNIGRDVKPEAEQLDGKVFQFQFGWEMDKDDSYPGEVAWIAMSSYYPQDAPAWLASGDLKRVYIASI